MTTPLIGVTGRRLSGTRMPAMEPRYQARDIDMYFSDYTRQVRRAGGVPIQVPYDAEARSIVGRLDGLLVTGGQDISPERWGGRSGDAEGDVDADRDAYETSLIEAGLALDVPILGICRGMQLLNVVRGGTMVADLPTSQIDHRGTGKPVEHLVHDVSMDQGTLAELVYGPSTSVNSLHHQSVDRPGAGVVISGRAPDGTPECIEMPGWPVLGVQWHPEWMPRHDNAFEWLVETSRSRASVSFR